jgi:hypothetical protein
VASTSTAPQQQQQQQLLGNDRSGGGACKVDGTERNGGAAAVASGDNRAAGPALVGTSEMTKKPSPQTDDEPNLSDDDDDDDDDDPFGLKDEAKKWLLQELQKYNANENSSGSSASSPYTPCNAAFNNGMIPKEHWDQAFEEFGRRFMHETSECYCKNGPSVLLVATGVTKDWWTPADEE